MAQHPALAATSHNRPGMGHPEPAVHCSICFCCYCPHPHPIQRTHPHNSCMGDELQKSHFSSPQVLQGCVLSHPPLLSQRLLGRHCVGRHWLAASGTPQSMDALTLLLHKLDSGTSMCLLHGMLLPRMQELACLRDPALMGGPGWLPVCLGPCQGRHMLQDMGAGHVCALVHKCVPTAAELAHAMSTRGIPS